MKSMTAFTRLAANFEIGDLTWEIRSVNHRYLEIALRLPEELRQFEQQVREKVVSTLNRGKIELNLRFTPTHKRQAININEELVQHLNSALSAIGDHIQNAQPATLMDILRWPGIVQAAQFDKDHLLQLTLGSLDDALKVLLKDREREGSRLQAMIKQRCHAAQQQVDLARKRMPKQIEQAHQRLQDRFSELKLKLDEARLEQEMALLIQRLDVDEEVDRLEAHIEEVLHFIEQDEPIGRRLDFLMQELNREANTLASKSQDKEQTAIAVELKVLIEQMREQAQNIE